MGIDKNIGKTIGIYTILGVCNHRDTDGHLLYSCKCNICNNILVRRLNSVKSATKCVHLDVCWNNSRLGDIFDLMKRRCYNAKHRDYRWYGAKGVKICDEWLNNPLSFEAWALNNGYGDTMTIDRIDPGKDYCPDNCQWISREDNSRKAGKVNWIDIDGTVLTGRQWSEKLCLGVNTMNRNICKYGLEKTKELIYAMLNEPPSTKQRGPRQTWFDVYGIQV